MGLISRIEGMLKGGEKVVKVGEEARKTYKAAQSGEKSRKIRVKRYDAYTNSNETTEGILGSSSNFLLIPSHSDIAMNVKPMWDDGILTVQKSARCHYSTDFQKIDAIIAKVRQKAKIKFTYEDFVEHIEIEGVEVSYDLGLWDNSWSMSFGSAANMITGANIMTMVMETPQRTLIYVAVIMYLLGIVCGGLLYMAMLFFVR